jgi:hypothetical protein
MSKITVRGPLTSVSNPPGLSRYEIRMPTGHRFTMTVDSPTKVWTYVRHALRNPGFLGGVDFG